MSDGETLAMMVDVTHPNVRLHGAKAGTVVPGEAWVVYQFGDGLQTHVLGSFATPLLAEGVVMRHALLLSLCSEWRVVVWFDGGEWLPCVPTGPTIGAPAAQGWGWSDGMRHIRMVRTEVQGG